MDLHALCNGLLAYLCFLIVLTFHEAAHAWAACKLGDDTARLQGRVSLNPLDHMEVVGTVILPLLGLFLGLSGSAAARFVIGWGKPVPVNPARLKNRSRDGMLTGLAGPAANVLVAFAAMMLVRIGYAVDSEMLARAALQLAVVSLFLCFFNMLPIPPLDGSHLARYIFGWREETMMRAGQFGIFIILLALQFQPVRDLLSWLTFHSVYLMGKLAGL